MTDVKIILFNGPPGSGKDFAARAILDDPEIQDNFDRHFDRFAMPIKKALAAIFDRPLDYYGVSRFDRNKEESNETLCGLSYRTSLIKMGASVRNTYGDGVFGMLLGRRISQHVALHGRDDFPQLIVVPDLGRDSELEALFEYYNPANVLIVKLSRQGKSFDHDSRRFVSGEPPRCVVHLNNTGVPEAFSRLVRRTVKDFLGVKSADDQQASSF